MTVPDVADLDRLAALAEKATCGPWDWYQTETGRAELFVPDGTMTPEDVLSFADQLDCEECVRPSDTDAEFIAAWNPRTALAVLAEVRRLRDENQQAKIEIAVLTERCAFQLGEMRRLAGQVGDLRADRAALDVDVPGRNAKSFTRDPCGCVQNAVGDIRCHTCGEYVNVQCWKCKTVRGQGTCPTAAALASGTED